MTSFIIVKLSNLHILLKITKAFSPVNFSFLECLDLILHGGWKTPPPVLHREEKAQCLRVKVNGIRPMAPVQNSVSLRLVQQVKH